jgi:hypothetical protein
MAIALVLFAAIALVLFAAIAFAGLVVGGHGSGARRLSGSCRWQVVGTRMMVAGLLALAIAARIRPQSAQYSGTPEEVQSSERY